MFRLIDIARAAPLTRRFKPVYSQLKRYITRSGSEIEEKLRKKFELMKPECTQSLYRDFDTYKKSLPVRERDGMENEWFKLYELPYFGADKDVQFMAQQLFEPIKAFRKVIKYVCAPATSGKTTSVLPAFLESNFTHYLYLAFDNNNDRQFKLKPSKPMDDLDCAERQGTAFAYECVRRLIEEPDKEDTHYIRIDVDPKSGELPTTKASVEKLKTLIGSYFGKQSYILFHVDEHRKMCHRGDTKNDPGAAFSRGVMQTLAKVGIVVATYIDPPFVPALGNSSAMCRCPVTMPQIDIRKVLQHLQLIVPRAKNRRARRLLSMLKFRLAMVFQPSNTRDDPTFGLEIGGLHQLETASQKLKDFVDSLRLKLENHDGLEQEKVLEECIEICVKPNVVTQKTPMSYATRLLLGMSDNDIEKAVEKVGREIEDLVVLENEHLSTTLFKLLSYKDKDSQLNDIYQKGCERFANVFEHPDLLCSQPLEEAYLWTISCRSAVESKLSFPLQKKAFKFHCTDIKPARIFDNDTDDFDVEFLEPHVLYYANEPGRSDHARSHPYADMFFRTALDELVLIDITGSSNSNKATQKAKKLHKMIPKMHRALKQGKWIRKSFFI